MDEINVEKVSASLQASPNAETSQSLLRNLSVTEGRNDRINLPDSAPNYEDRQSGRSPSVGSLFSTCPSSEIIEDTASVSCPSTDENEIWLEFPMPEDNEGGVHCHSSAAFSSFVSALSIAKMLCRMMTLSYTLVLCCLETHTQKKMSLWNSF